MLEEHERPEKGELRPRFGSFATIASCPATSRWPKGSANPFSSAVLVIVMSENYVAEDSDWCRREREAFLQRSAAAPGESGRIFVVARTPFTRRAGPPNSSNWSAINSGNATGRQRAVAVVRL